jgi:hypothetical protein
MRLVIDISLANGHPEKLKAKSFIGRFFVCAFLFCCTVGSPLIDEIPRAAVWFDWIQFATILFLQLYTEEELHFPRPNLYLAASG